MLLSFAKQSMNKFFLYLRTETFRKNLLVAIGSILAFLFIIFFILRFYTRHAQSIPVPALQGLAVESAIEILKTQGLNYEIDSVYQVDKKPGTVIEQDPDANTNVKANRTVYLTIINRQAPNASFPDIHDKIYLEAEAILRNAGLKIGDTVYTSDIALDRVLEATFAGQPIKKGELIPKGSRIGLVLGDGRGSGESDIPNLIGLSLSEARFPLRQALLSLGNVMYEGTINDTANAIIIRQMPALSDTLTKISIGSRIDVVISNGK